MTICVNFAAGPGAGKSTLCAETFAKLKWAGVNCEMVTEYAKDKTWEGSFAVLENQIYVFGKQQHRIHRLRGKVDVIITDSPLFLSLQYDKTRNVHLRGLVMGEMAKCDNMTYFLHRTKGYNPMGRSQTEPEAREIDNNVEDLLVRENIAFTKLVADEEAAEFVACEVLKKMGFSTTHRVMI